MFTLFNRPEHKPTPAGSRWKINYIIEIDKAGKKVLKESGRTNIYEIIQESLEETKLDNIIRRATLGDETVLNVLNGQFMDVTEMPTSFMEMQNLVLKAKAEFNKLPLEIRKKFDMSPEQYINEYGSKEFLKKMGYEPAAAEPAKTAAETEPKKGDAE